MGNPYAPHHAGPYTTGGASAEGLTDEELAERPPWLDDIPEDERDRFRFRAEAAFAFLGDAVDFEDRDDADARRILAALYSDRETFEAAVDDILEAGDDLADVSVTGDGVVVVSVRDADGELLEVRTARGLARSDDDGPDLPPADTEAGLSAGVDVDGEAFRWDFAEESWLRLVAGDDEDDEAGWVPVDDDDLPEGLPDPAELAAAEAVDEGLVDGDEDAQPETEAKPEGYADDVVPTTRDGVFEWLDEAEGEDDLRARAEAARRVENALPEDDRRVTVVDRLASILDDADD